MTPPDEIAAERRVVAFDPATVLAQRIRAALPLPAPAVDRLAQHALARLTRATPEEPKP